MLSETLWRMAQESRRLQDLRREIEGIWNDTAARDLNSRYLHPHQDDDAQMGSSYRQQNDNLDQSEDKIAAAHEHGNSANQLSAQISETLNIADEEIRNAHRSYDLYVGYQADARAQLPLVQDFIRRANSACS